MPRPQENRDLLQVRVSPETIVELHEIAIELGFIHGDKGAIGRLLDAIVLVDRSALKKIIEKTIDE